MNSNLIDLHKELKRYFGFNQFKGLQEQVIKSIVAKKNKPRLNMPFPKASSIVIPVISDRNTINGSPKRRIKINKFFGSC